LSKELTALPLAITKNGKVIGYIVPTLAKSEQIKLAPAFCPIHNRMKLGEKYACGCDIAVV